MSHSPPPDHDPPTPDDRWEACPEGLLSETARHLRADQHRSMWTRGGWQRSAGLAALVLLAITAGTWGYLASNRSSQASEPLTCRETIQVLGPYTEGRLKPTLASRVRAHLDDCPGCSRRERQRRRLRMDQGSRAREGTMADTRRSPGWHRRRSTAVLEFGR